MGMITRLNVLGPVRAWRDDQEIALGPPQQRCVLGLIAMAGGDPVPTWRLVNALWGAAPPPSALNVVRTYLKRLRRLLDPERPRRGVSAMLPRVADGYALGVAAETVDLWRFRVQAATAREARRLGEHHRVVSLLTEALASWRSLPADDDAVAEEHPRLTAVVGERWTAVSWLAESALACGREDEALTAVEVASNAKPCHEPLHAYLVRIYHALGRRADAVRTFHAVRRRLRDELGFQPGPELTTAYQALLREDRSRPAPV